jgi:hypothetical protein
MKKVIPTKTIYPEKPIYSFNEWSKFIKNQVTKFKKPKNNGNEK